MAIVTQDYYESTYYGEPVATADFPRFEARAEDMIARITRQRMTEATFDTLPPVVQTIGKKAICAQIEYYAYNGVDIANAGRLSEGFTVGNVSINGSGKAPTGAASMVCPAAVAYLEQSGLLNPSVPVAVRRCV